MHLSTVAEWLSWLTKQHPSEIDLGLERVKQVASRLSIKNPPCPVIMVAGTNGKGSTVAGLDAIYRAAGFRVGAFTSPYLWRYNEQIKIEGQEVSDSVLCHAFTEIAACCGDISLTLFEWGTLAAFYIFQEEVLDIWLLEVGLGGRLDAVNILDADVAIVTSISLDHTEWLGSTRELIGREKAGIFRSTKPAICGDLHPPQSILHHAKELGTPLFCQGQHFRFEEAASDWCFQSEMNRYEHLPFSKLATQNMSVVLMAIELLQTRLPVLRPAIDQGLKDVKLTGRVQIIPGAITEIVDVSHNPDSIAHLAKALTSMDRQGKTIAVFSMLADKDSLQSVLAIRQEIDVWYIAPLATKRGMTLLSLQQVFEIANIPNVFSFHSIQEAYQAARAEVQPGDYLVVFGSFHAVSEVYSNLA